MNAVLPHPPGPTLPETWWRVDSGPGTADFNMALDEALLETVAALSRPVLRFYRWTERAATFGYFQSHAEISRLTRLRPLIRRPTGGGLSPRPCRCRSARAPTTCTWARTVESSTACPHLAATSAAF